MMEMQGRAGHKYPEHDTLQLSTARHSTPQHTTLTNPTIIHVSCVGVVLPSTAPKAIMAEPAQKVASITRGSSRVMSLWPLPKPCVRGVMTFK